MKEGIARIETEQLTICRDRGSGLVAVIAIDDTTHGPALGGIRWRTYPSEEAAIEECQRLARVMTYKNALAEISFGGGKSVIIDRPQIQDRAEALRAFGRFVARLGGAYIPAADMGTSVEDLQIVGETADDVSCDDEDPSVSTADGVLASIDAAVRVCGLGPDLGGIRVLVQGAGHVGERLSHLLAAAGADVLVTDLRADQAQRVAAAVGGTVVDPATAVCVPCDVFAPCATARVVDGQTVGQIRARIIAGAANDVLAIDDLAEELRRREIVYVPDFVANAGGVIQVRALRDAWPKQRLADALAAIGDRTERVLTAARDSGRTPLAVAVQAAQAALGRGPEPVTVD